MCLGPILNGLYKVEAELDSILLDYIRGIRSRAHDLASVCAIYTIYIVAVDGCCEMVYEDKKKTYRKCNNTGVGKHQRMGCKLLV